MMGRINILINYLFAKLLAKIISITKNRSMSEQHSPHSTAYEVLARKHRPQTFLDVVAQGPIVATLKNALRMHRSAHAYLFCGCRGTGKTTLARLFAKALNCTKLSEDTEPCNACQSCREIAASRAIDVLEIDGASHRGIEDMRQINETISFLPTSSPFKIYLIDEVHMLTKEAFNALLKTLEEPPPHIKFLFCTTEPHKIPATILSRCQRFNLRRIPSLEIESKLSQIASNTSITISKEALTLIAERAEGSLRDALSLFDQILAFEKENITADAVTTMLGLPSKELFFDLDTAGTKKDLSAAFKITGEVFASGTHLPYFLEELISHFRALFLVKQGIVDARSQYKERASLYRSEQLIQILEYLIEGQQNIKSAPSERTALEMLLLRILQTHQKISLENLVERLISLEQKTSISENPRPKLEELPTREKSTQNLSCELPSDTQRQTILENLPKPSKEEPTKKILPSQPLLLQEQSRFDTVMRFAAKELNGSFKKE